MEGTHRKSGSSAMDFTENKVNRLVLGFFLKRRGCMMDFCLNWELLTEKRSSCKTVLTLCETSIWRCSENLATLLSVRDQMPPAHAWQNCLPPDARLSWCGRLCSFPVTWKESSQTRETLWRPLFLSLFWLCVLNTKPVTPLIKLTISRSYWTSALE